MKYHPIASIFPLMEGQEYEYLKANIEKNGIIEAITVYEDKILDGRNRARACSELGTEPATRTFTGTPLEAIERVWALNRARRHLNPSQAAIAAARCEQMTADFAPVREAAKERQREHGGTAPGRPKTLTQLIAPVKDERTVAALRAKAAGTNRTYISQADRLIREHPDLAEQVERGKKTLHQVAREVKALAREESVREARQSAKGIGSDDDIRIECADAFKVLAGIKAGSVDCIITDPPYNVTGHGWDQFKSAASYLEFIKKVLVECRRILKPEYHFFMFCDPDYMARIESMIVSEEVGLELKSRIVWVRKNISMGRVISDRFISQWEPVFHAGTMPLNFPPKWGDERGDVQTFAVPQSNFKDEKIHPTQKPLDLVRRFVELGTQPGGLVVDPFCGGGTTALACRELKRRCITCDGSEDYVALAKVRVFGK